MLDSLLGLGIGLGVLSYLLRVDEEIECIKSASQGSNVDVHILASAYWNKYAATHVPKSQWLKFNRYEKAQVFEKREELKGYFENFDFKVQTQVNSVRPRDFSIAFGNREDKQIAKIPVSDGAKIGQIVGIAQKFGFIRPAMSVTQYFFHASEVEGRQINRFSIGDTAVFILSQNQKGLCAIQVRRHNSPPKQPDRSRNLRAYPQSINNSEVRTVRSFGGQMSYVCEYCSQITVQEDSNVGRCSSCGRTGMT